MDIVPDSSGEMGNTNNHLPIQISPALHWFFTWNNYPDNWLELLKFHSSKISAYIFGVEVGASGTKHIQAGLGWDIRDINKDRKRAWAEYDKQVGGGRIKLVDKTNISVGEVGELLDKTPTSSQRI